MRSIWLSILILSLSISACDDRVVTHEAHYGDLNEKAPTETAQYGQLAGKWDCVIRSYQGDSLLGQTNAMWEFKYVLDGYAVQDFWTNPAAADNAQLQQILGTNIRIYNPNLKLWQCAWMENQSGSISGIWQSHMRDDGSILLYDSSSTWQIEFYNITKEQFDWKWQIKQTDGSMTTTATIKAKKIS